MDRQARIRENLRQFIKTPIAEANEVQDAPSGTALPKPDQAKPIPQTLAPLTATPAAPLQRKRITWNLLNLKRADFNPIRTLGRYAAHLAVIALVAIAVLVSNEFVADNISESLKAWSPTLLTVGTRGCEFLALSTLVCLRFKPIAWAAALLLEAIFLVGSGIASAGLTWLLVQIVGDGTQIRFEIAGLIGIPLFSVALFVIARGNALISEELDGWNLHHEPHEPDAAVKTRGSAPPPAPRAQNIRLN